MEREFTVGSLFAGIGGFDLGFERAGFKTVWQVEINEWCRKVLAKNFPNAERYADIRDCGSQNLVSVDVIVGGFPCQDISNAGLRAGIGGGRSGLWKEMLRVIGELRPKFVLVENVAALLGRGMGVVLGDLSEIGYDAEWEVVSAADVGAPHLRERVWIVAYPVSLGCIGQGSSEEPSHHQEWNDSAYRKVGRAVPGEAFADGEVLAYTSCELLNGGRDFTRQAGRNEPSNGGEDAAHSEEFYGGQGWTGGFAGDGADGEGERPEALADANSDEQYGRRCDVQVGRRWSQGEAANNGHASGTQWSAEPNVGRVAHGVPARVDRLRGLGNAVVPQIPELYARRIHELLTNHC